MNRRFIDEILNEYEKTRDMKKKELEYRKDMVYEKVPRIQEIDEQLALTGIKISRLILSNPEESRRLIAELKHETDRLKKERAFILTENNMPLTFLEMEHECDLCSDTGFVPDGSKCQCFKQKVVDRTYEMSNISAILERDNFENFNMDLFSKDKIESRGISPFEQMQEILSYAEGFVHNFKQKKTPNLLLFGSTGLGKTYLCSCIAKALIDKGYLVVYQTAFQITEIMETYKFSKTKSTQMKLRYDLLFNSDLLIIDDLGTEMTNTFTNVEFFNVINSRLMNEKKIVISTNLEPGELVKIYGQRIASRVLTSVEPLEFIGSDLRWE